MQTDKNHDEQAPLIIVFGSAAAQPTERGTAMFDAMLSRSAAAIEKCLCLQRSHVTAQALSRVYTHLLRRFNREPRQRGAASTSEPSRAAFSAASTIMRR